MFFWKLQGAVPKPMVYEDQKSKNMIGFGAGPRPQIEVVTHIEVKEWNEYKKEFLKEKK